MHHRWRPPPGAPSVVLRRVAGIRPIIVSIPLPRAPSKGLGSPLTVIYGFILLTLVGMGLLSLPFSTTSGSISPPLTSFFTAASAITVTGLTVVDTPTYWSPVGQSVILSLILIGGMGWMALAGLVVIALGQRIALPQRLAFREYLQEPRLGGVFRLLRNMTLTFLGLQLLGGVLLALRFRETLGWGWDQALWQGWFHAISGFNNAGFSILPDSDSLGRLANDALALSVVAVMISLGGLSFPVMADILRVRRFHRFSLDTKMVLVGSVLLWALGALVIFGFEYQNPLTLGPMSLGGKILNATFHSIAARTAGLNTIEIGGLVPASAFFVMGLMAIGAASASTGGGIRLNTLGVLVASVWATLRGQSHVSAFGREIAPDQVQRAVTIVFLAASFAFLTALFLTFMEQRHRFIDLLFEMVSAMGTVGFTLGVTPELSAVGKLLIVLAMALGRMGPLVLALALTEREQRAPGYRHVQERVKLG